MLLVQLGYLLITTRRLSNGVVEFQACVVEVFPPVLQLFHDFHLLNVRMNFGHPIVIDRCFLLL